MTEHLPSGYNGKILRVNLSDKTTSVEKIEEKFCRKYIGGAGFSAYYLYKILKQGIGPLGPDNKLIFALGPLTGISLGGASRYSIGAKSPLTGGIIQSEAGGNWGPELKYAGYDGIIVEGKAERPVYLWIHDEEVSIEDASHLWGKQTRETLDSIREELGDNRVQVAMIGPGGENLIRYACIMSGLHDAAGRGGAGAVMGSKNLKAIAVRGSNRPKVATPEGVKELREWLLKNREIWSGTASGGTMDFGYAMEQAVTEGNLSVNNFRDGIFPDAKLIERNSIRIGMDGCFACPVHCKKVCKVDGPYNVDPIYGGPEYETLGTLGTNCGISDIKAIAKGNELCQANSLDTISTGMVISFAMECFENGLLSTEDTSGIDLRFGNAAAMIKTIELIAKREAIGNLLAEGSAKAAKIIGKGAKKFSMDVKGLEIPMHEPRLKQILGLGYMVNPHGADHNCNVHDTMIAVKGRSLEWLKPLMGELEPLSVDDVGPLKVAIFRMTQLDRILNDSLVLCHWVPYPFTRRVNVTAAVTGWDVGALELLRVAERTITMFRLINIREGFTAEDDKLPERFFQPKSGALADKPLNHEKMERAKSYYYTLMGWDAQSGIPLKEKVEELLIP